MALFRKNFEKEGPGVYKNEPEKKSFFKFFELFFRNFWKLMTANIYFVVLSIPLLTTGLSQIGLTYISRMCARDKHVFLTSDFFDAIKKNWKKALPLGILNFLLTAIFCFNVSLVIWGGMDKTWQIVMLGFNGFIFTVYSFAKFYQYTMLITFNFSVFKCIKNSIIFATLGIKQNIITGGILFLNYLFLFLMLVNFAAVGYAFDVVYLIFIFPSLRFFLIQFNIFPVIKKYIIDPYYAEHPDDDIQKRRDLGVYEEPEDEDDDYYDESVFQDDRMFKRED